MELDLQGTQIQIGQVQLFTEKTLPGVVLVWGRQLCHSSARNRS